MSSSSDESSGTHEVKVKRVGNYLLGRTLGTGSFGKVKLATHTITQEKVALKILDKDRIRDVADMERITREINVLKLLDHPNVIKLYEVIDTQRHIYIVMEYSDGGELFDYIVHHGRLKEKEACRFFHMLMNGVDYCHKHFVIHRDLKPENLLLNSHRQLKIIDFGLSNRIKPGGMLKTACGSPCYAAPEMIEGKMYAGQASDIWSCGVILFALVCGYLPFEDQNTQALYQKILHARYRCPPTLSAECRHLIGKILNTDPTKRYTIEQIRQHPWYTENFPKDTVEEIVVKPIVQIASSDPSAPPQTMELDSLESVIDESVVSELQKLGFPRENTISSIRAKKHNQIVAAYRILLEKRMREAAESGKQYVIIPVSDTPAPSAPSSSPKALPPSVAQTASATPKPKAERAVILPPLGNRTPSAASAARPEQKPAAPSQPTEESVQPITVQVQKKREDADEQVMAAAKASTTQTRRRYSLMPTTGKGANAAALAFVRNQFAKKPVGPTAKDEEGKEIIPSSFDGQLKVGARPKPKVAAPAGLAALPDDDEMEEDEDASGLIAQAAAEAAKRRGAAAAPPSARPGAATAAAHAAAAAAARASLASSDDSEGEEMPQEMQQRQIADRQKAVARRRTSIATTKDAQATLVQHQKDKQAAAPSSAAAQNKDVRVFRGLFNVSATSSKPPSVVLDEVMQQLRKKRIPFKKVEGSYILKCDLPEKSLRFEVEICKLPRLEEVCFVNMKRIAGETFVWKDFCTQFFSSLQL